ncbi:MAG: response regulator [Proteobacteria bacterium]|nr:response regulator [Pseudomonadota bacterium]MBU1386541.1 response regulator [Pseudomonadota bacterium]MBU1544652.1 response regulator [Pseudomonadota bacterium]MBU2430581.1 response regulator [Pseudomonadota bacterium]MBU2481369.1 response regulator [Pseudomonadota bacterium]
MAKYQILIVDDSRMMRNIIKGYLAEFDCDTMEAIDGEMGLHLARENHFDLIITDVEMPRKDGIALCRALKKDPATRGIPILITSSFDSEEDIHKGFQAGAVAYLSKDEVPNQLYTSVESILSKSSFNTSKLIMIVDDSNMIRTLVATELSKSGYRTETAQNGADALEKLKSRRPDLILSDIDMPIMNGFEFCEALQKDKHHKTIPFIVMSANSDRGHMQRMLKRGAQAYLVKPFNMDQVTILVDKLLSDHFVLLLKDRERLDSERRMMLSTITSLVNALEARDAYTKGHSTAVAGIAAALARLSGSTDKDIQNILIGGHLHDIGKIGISDAILLKPEHLSEIEFGTIKEHPIIGANILSPIESLSNIIPMVRHHHERMDGKGYPDGLKGSKIPLWARMTAVADTFHALTSNRPYRKGMKMEKAVQIIEDVKGTQLCPDCVDLFFQWINQDNSEKIKEWDEVITFEDEIVFKP